jgi:hypothetical protein
MRLLSSTPHPRTSKQTNKKQRGLNAMWYLGWILKYKKILGRIYSAKSE